MNWISKYLAVWQSRIVLGLAFFAAILVGLWPDHTREIDAEKLIACLATGIAWFVAELASAVTKVSNHDIALFERINNVMDDSALTFLMDHDFHNDARTIDTEPVSNMAYWHGPNATFNDKAIQRRWEAVFASIVALSHTYGDNLVTTDVEGRLTAWHTGFTRANQPDQAHAEVKELNDAARALYVQFGEFVVYVRKRLDL